jgi:hypothetical protein
MPDAEDVYLIWSHKVGAWWRGDGEGYTRQLSQAARYNQRAALAICVRSIAGAFDLGALPTLPVRLEDIEAMVRTYKATSALGLEPWE